MSIEGTVGGNAHGPTRDAEDLELTGHEFDWDTRDENNEPSVVTRGDKVEVVHMDDPQLQRYVGHVGECEWVQDVFPFAQVILVFSELPGNDGLEPLSTFSAWVRKVS